MGCSVSKPGAAHAPAQARVDEIDQKDADGGGDAGAIERNAGGSEEPHSEDPELWNIGGTEMDLNAKYKAGKHMCYVQTRAHDAIRDKKAIAGSPFNQKAKDAQRLYGVPSLSFAEPHSADPELWNIGGTEIDLNATYKVGKQMWYLQSRATDAIQNKKAIAGSPVNQKAKDATRRFVTDS